MRWCRWKKPRRWSRTSLMRLLSLILLCAAAASAADFDARFADIRDHASPRDLYAFLRAVPKGADLHHHGILGALAEELYQVATDPAVLHGNEFFTRISYRGCADSVEPFLRFRNVRRATRQALSACAQEEYAALATLDPATKAEWLSSLKLDRPGEGRDEFFEGTVNRVGDLARDMSVSAELLARMLMRYRTEGLHYLETQMRLNAFVDAAGQPVSGDEAVAYFQRRLAQPDVRDQGIPVRFIYSVIRFQPQAEQQIEQGYAFVDQHRDSYVAINLVGREDNGKGNAPRFLETFRKMRRRYSGIHLTIHGGELDQPGTEVRQTLLLGAERIGHGVNLISDPDTMLLMRYGRVPVEISLVSNQLLEYTPDLAVHPFPEYLRLGIPVTLNTDDPGHWDSNLVDEYFLATTLYNLTWPEVTQLGRQSLEYSFAPASLKAQLLADYDRQIAEFEKRFSSGDWRGVLASLPAAPTGYARRRLQIPLP